MGYRFVLPGAIILMIFLGTASSVVLAYERTDEVAKVIFDVCVYDVDLSTDTAKVNIGIKFSNLFIEYLHPRENITAIIASEVNVVEIKCNRTVEEGVFVGCSGVILWNLEGALGKGEYFPFETYELVFRLANIIPGKFNMSKIELDTSYSFVSFEGAKKLLLAKIFEADENDRILLKMGFRDKLTIVAFLSRKIGPFNLPTLFWPTVLPILACFYVLVNTLWLTGEKSLEHRILVYISLLIFCPSFLIALQEYLPLRASLSIPEVLLEVLLVSTAVFTILSLVPAKTTLQELMRDAAILFFSLFSVVFILSHFMSSFPASALSTFFYTFFAYAIVALFIWSSRCFDEVLKTPRDLVTILSGVTGLICICLGFTLIALLFQNSAVIFIGVIFIIIGSCLLLYHVRYKRRVWYWLYPAQHRTRRKPRKPLISLKDRIWARIRRKS